MLALWLFGCADGVAASAMLQKTEGLTPEGLRWAKMASAAAACAACMRSFAARPSRLSCFACALLPARYACCACNATRSQRSASGRHSQEQFMTMHCHLPWRTECTGHGVHEAIVTSPIHRKTATGVAHAAHLLETHVAQRCMLGGLLPCCFVQS